MLFSHFSSKKFSSACSFENSFLYNFGKLLQIDIPGIFYSIQYNARSTDPDIQYNFRFCYSMKCSSNKWIILRNICKNDQFSTSDGIIIFGKFSGLLDFIGHKIYSIHVNTGFCGCNIYTCCDPLCFR